MLSPRPLFIGIIGFAVDRLYIAWPHGKTAEWAKELQVRKRWAWLGRLMAFDQPSDRQLRDAWKTLRTCVALVAMFIGAGVEALLLQPPLVWVFLIQSVVLVLVALLA